jgi:predicted nucleic-acid-binding protein
MKITADTSVLIRAAVQDDARQARQAAKVMQEADLVAVPIPVLCEFVWVLRRGYKRSVADISDAIHRLMDGANVVMNRPAVEAGLSVLGAGGDFADGIIAYEGDWLGAEEFVSFDSKSVSILQSQGSRARLLGVLGLKALTGFANGDPPDRSRTAQVTDHSRPEKSA